MGTGKSEVSKRFAVNYGMEYISTDEMIEKKESMSINDIFKIKGEDYFRDIEKRIVKKVSTMDNVVIDAGGGVVLDYENIESLKSNGVIICLKAEAKEILKRLEYDNNRPLLDVKDKLQKIDEMLKKREPYYSKIERVIDTSNLTIDEVLDRVRSIFESSII